MPVERITCLRQDTEILAIASCDWAAHSIRTRSNCFKARVAEPEILVGDSIRFDPPPPPTPPPPPFFCCSSLAELERGPIS